MTSRDVYFLGNACAFSSRKAVSVPTSVICIGGLGAPWRPAILRVCVCVIVVIWAESADVGLWVAVCFPGEDFFT